MDDRLDDRMDDRAELMKQSLELIDVPAVIVSDKGEVTWQNKAAAPMKLTVGYSVEPTVKDFERQFAAWDYYRNCRLNVTVRGKPMVMTISRIGPVNLLLFTTEDEATDKVETVLLSLFHGMDSVATGLIYALRELAPELEELNDSTIDRKLAEVTRASYRLVRSATDMALLGQIEPEDQRIFPREVPLRAFFERLAEKEAEILRECQVKLKYHLAIKDTAFGNVDATLVEKMIATLLCNAVKYGEKGAPVALDVVHDGKNVRFTVSNTGENINGSELSSVFTRYLQTPDLENLQTGAGMGLAVVRELAQRHGGAIVIRSDKGGTFVVVSLDVTLPQKLGAHAPLLASAHRYDLSLVELSDVLPLDTFLSYAVEC